MASIPGTVLITGGSRGIGAATARLAAQRGYDVCFTYAERHEAAQQVVAAVQRLGRFAHAMQADGGDAQAMAALLERLPPLRAPLAALVNNTGVTGPLGPFVGQDVATFRRVLDVNVLGLMALTQQVVRRWQTDGTAGAIVNVSSIAASLGAPGEYVHYAASKAAVEAFTVGLAKELAGQGIRVNAVSPGTTLTEIHATAGEPGRPQRVAARIPMQRPGEAEEIAAAIVWMLSPEASYVTGTTLKVAGGL